jgi:hypothetical protein
MGIFDFLKTEVSPEELIDAVKDGNVALNGRHIYEPEAFFLNFIRNIGEFIIEISKENYYVLFINI